MIRRLEIENFKSIKNLKLDCKRINIFIGEPNTGKSNILETLGLFSHVAYGGYSVRDFVRMENMSNLFYDENLEEPIKIEVDNKVLEIAFKDGRFKGVCRENETGLFSFDYDYNGDGHISLGQREMLLPFRFYRFAIRSNFPRKESDFLLPPFGENLLTILLTHGNLKSVVSQIFNQFGLKLLFKPHENRIEVAKLYKDILISYPYSLASETLQRVVFYLAAISTSRKSVLAFEEPAAHAFPYYTKFLAERIALDDNQYFISTHDPYFLLSILEKALKDDVSVHVTYFEDYQTKVRTLDEKGIERLMDFDVDVFFNIESLLEK